MELDGVQGMFDDLNKRLGSAFGRFRARGLLTEANIQEGLREVRTALLEADVSLSVVQELMERITEKAVGAQLIKSIKATTSALHHMELEEIAQSDKNIFQLPF